jgi:hypothetical protein
MAIFTIVAQSIFLQGRYIKEVLLQFQEKKKNYANFFFVKNYLIPLRRNFSKSDWEILGKSRQWRGEHVQTLLRRKIQKEGKETR